MAADDRHREPRRKLRDPIDAALLGALVGFVVVAPWMRRGWLLLLDWAPGPRDWRPAGGASLPTGPAFTIPMSALHAVFGAASSWLPVFIVLAAATAGAARLFDGPLPARLACGLGYGWNPWTFDRLAVGQLSVLAGYAVLPWLLRAALRADSRRGAVVVGLWWALAASCTVHFAWIGGVLVLGVVLTRPSRRTLAGGAIAAALMAAIVGAWVWLQHAPAAPGDARVLGTFGTLPDPDLGRSFGLLAEQGFWRPVVTRPAADLGVAFPLVAAAVIGATGLGLLAARRTRRARLAAAVTIAGGFGWLLAHGAAGATGAAYRFAFAHVPGFGVMREAQKWEALVCLAIAVGLGSCAAWIAQTRLRRAAWAIAVLPIVLAPTLAFGLANRIEPSRYPASWQAVRTEFDALPGTVIALPWTEYVATELTANRSVTDPLGSYFGHRVLMSRDAGVPGLSGDTGRRGEIARAVGAATADAAAGRPVRLGAALHRLGVSGILVAGDAGLPLGGDPGLVRRVTGDGLVLYAVGSLS